MNAGGMASRSSLCPGPSADGRAYPACDCAQASLGWTHQEIETLASQGLHPVQHFPALGLLGFSFHSSEF